MIFDRILAAFRSTAWRHDDAQPIARPGHGSATGEPAEPAGSPAAGPLIGAERAAYFAALRRKADGLVAKRD